MFDLPLDLQPIGISACNLIAVQHSTVHLCLSYILVRFPHSLKCFDIWKAGKPLSQVKGEEHVFTRQETGRRRN